MENRRIKIAYLEKNIATHETAKSLAEMHGMELDAYRDIYSDGKRLAEGNYDAVIANPGINTQEIDPDFALKLKAIGVRAPVIIAFTSDRGDEGDKRACLENGFTDFVYKPFISDAIKKAQSYVNGGRQNE